MQVKPHVRLRAQNNGSKKSHNDTIFVLALPVRDIAQGKAGAARWRGGACNSRQPLNSPKVSLWLLLLLSVQRLAHTNNKHSQVNVMKQ